MRPNGVGTSKTGVPSGYQLENGNPHRLAENPGTVEECSMEAEKERTED